MRTSWLIPIALLSGSALAQPAADKAKPPSEAGKPEPITPTDRPDRDPMTEPAPPAPPVAPAIDAPVQPVEPPVSADDVSSAPPPGSEHGRLDPLDEGDGVGRKIGRTLMYIPRLPLEIIVQPARGALYLKEKYDAINFITNIFTTEDRKIAVYPTVLFETNNGLSVGGRATMKDVLGENEKISLRAGFGGRWRSIAELEVTTDKNRALQVGMEARYEKRGNERFYGYGNGDEIDTTPALIDPIADDTAVKTKYQIGIWRLAPRVRWKPSRFISITATGAFMSRDAEDDPMDLRTGDVGIGSAYEIGQVSGFGDPVQYIYSELEVAYDSRRAGDIYDPTGWRTAGGYASVFGGRENPLSEDALAYYRVGVDLQKVIRIYGQRNLQLRFYGETVTGDREDIPFFGLARLGGQQMLRGYDRDRFRDKVATVAQAAYTFPLTQFLGMSLFTDVGRVHESLRDLSIDKPRVGYGGALELYGAKGMVVRAEIASSIDGNLFMYVSVDPAFDALARVERR